MTSEPEAPETFELPDLDISTRLRPIHPPDAQDDPFNEEYQVTSKQVDAPPRPFVTSKRGRAATRPQDDQDDDSDEPPPPPPLPTFEKDQRVRTVNNQFGTIQHVLFLNGNTNAPPQYLVFLDDGSEGLYTGDTLQAAIVVEVPQTLLEGIVELTDQSRLSVDGQDVDGVLGEEIGNKVRIVRLTDQEQ